MNKQWLIIGAIVAVLFVSYLWNRNKNNNGVEEETPIVEEIITQEDGTVVKKTGEMIEEISAEEQAQRKQEINEKVAEETPVSLNPQEGVEGSGSFQRTYQEETFYQKVKVENLAPLEKGYYYEAWLQKDGEAISIGRLEMTGGTGELYYQAKADRTEYRTVIITKEVEDGNTDMGQKVLEGTVE